jgi:hypothetical protein
VASEGGDGDIGGKISNGVRVTLCVAQGERSKCAGKLFWAHC